MSGNVPHGNAEWKLRDSNWRLAAAAGEKKLAVIIYKISQAHVFPKKFPKK
jgi:hypothetical protein